MTKEPVAIRFEAALSPIGTCFSLNADGEAKLILVVPEQTAEPLARAMAEKRLQGRTFIVTITMAG